MSVFRRIAVGEFIFESAQDSIVAAGTTQATAFQLQNVELNRITTVAAGAGVLLPPSQPGMTIVVVNHGANAVQVYGQPGDTIDDAASANGVAQMKNSWVIYTCFTAGAWYTEGLASGFQAFYSGAFSTQSAYDGLTGSTTHTPAGGTQIQGNQVRFATVANANDAATLPPAKAGMQVVVQNSGVSNLQVWCATAALGGASTSDLVNASATSFTITSGSTTPTVFYSFSDGQWFTK